MKCALVTIHDYRYQPLADISWTQNRLLYAESRGYGTVVKTDNFPVSNIGFAKIALLIDVLKSNEYELIHWSGADTLITNFTIPLTEFLYKGYDITIASDFNAINTDSIVIRNTSAAIDYFQMIMDKMPEYLTAHWFEQSAMIDSLPSYKDLIKIVPQRFLNSYHYPFYRDACLPHDQLGFNGQWQIGDFLLHMPAQSVHQRIKHFNTILPHVIKV